MPWLARQKRKLATQVASASLSADATESAICGYLPLITLAGLLVNVIFHAPRADPIAAVVLVPFIAREGWKPSTLRDTAATDPRFEPPRDNSRMVAFAGN